MADRTFTEQGELIKKVRILRPTIAVGAAGAVTLKRRVFNQPGYVGVGPSITVENAPTSGVGYSFGDGIGTRSVARTGAGAWTLTLSDSYQYLLGLRIALISNATGASVSGLSIASVSGITNVATNTALGNGGVIALVISSAASTATDPADGDTLTLEITLGDATEP